MLRKFEFPLLAPPSDPERLSHAATPSSKKTIKDDESPDDDKEHRGAGKISSKPEGSESSLHFDMLANLSRNYMKNKRDEDHKKHVAEESENIDDPMVTYVRYRIAGGRMKFKESDTGREQYYTRFPGIELEEIGDWEQDYNNIAQFKWAMSNAKYI